MSVYGRKIKVLRGIIFWPARLTRRTCAGILPSCRLRSTIVPSRASRHIRTYYYASITLDFPLRRATQSLYHAACTLTVFIHATVKSGLNDLLLMSLRSTDFHIRRYIQVLRINSRQAITDMEMYGI